MSNDNPNITHTITLAEHNFIVETLNKNPLGAPVMQVAALISKLNATASAVVEKIRADEAAAAKVIEKAANEQGAAK